MYIYIYTLYVYIVYTHMNRYIQQEYMGFTSLLNAFLCTCRCDMFHAAMIHGLGYWGNSYGGNPLSEGNPGDHVLFGGDMFLKCNYV